MVEGIHDMNIDRDMADVIVAELGNINIRADMVRDPNGRLSTATFDGLSLKPELIRATVENGFEHPSEVQQQYIPQVDARPGYVVPSQVRHRRKTAVFVLSTLQQLEPIPGQVSVIVLCHTCELTCLIKGEYTRFGKSVLWQHIATDKAIFKDKNRCPHVIVGTPGRVKALVEQDYLKVENAKHFVLDERDKMLESKDMHRDMQQIFTSAPRSKQVLMFSATMGELVYIRFKRFMVDPQEVYVDHETNIPLHGLTHYYVVLTESEKNRKLVELLDNLEFNQVCIFFKSMIRAQQLDRLLKGINFPFIAIHAQMDQETRTWHFQEIKDFKKHIVVTTDVFSRGVYDSQINVVINYDCPFDANTYLHRVGRRGRFGTKAVAISFVSSDDDKTVLKNAQDRFEIEIHELPGELDVADYMNE